MLKRTLDVIIALLGLVILAPLFAILAVVVRLDSPGPIFFRQQRVGRGGKEFDILKFRTMQHTSAGTGPLITVAGDRRLTRAAGFLRKCKLDELPQLFNVLVGDMSLVGPRPEVPRYVACYPLADRELVLSVRPGITDNASIEFFDENRLLAESSDPERTYVEQILPRKIASYRQYVREHSLLGDLHIIVRTLGRVLRGRLDAPKANVANE